MTVMKVSVQYCGSDDVVGKDLVPFGKRTVRCQDDRPFLIPAGDQFEQELGTFQIQRKIAEFIDDEKVDASEKTHDRVKTILLEGGFEFIHQRYGVNEIRLWGCKVFCVIS